MSVYLKRRNFQSNLQQKAEENLGEALSFLEKRVSSHSPKKKTAIELKHRFKLLEQDYRRGLIDEENFSTKRTRTFLSVNKLIFNLSDADLNKEEEQKAAYNQKGAIVYWIPQVMQLDRATSCYVRLTDNDENYPYCPGEEEDCNIKSIEVAEVVEVSLNDPGDEPAFEIQSLSYDEQFIAEENFSLWNFRVKPLMEGVFHFELRINVVEDREGKKFDRQIIIKKQVTVVTGTPSPRALGRYQRANIDIRYTSSGGRPYFEESSEFNGAGFTDKLVRPLVGKLNPMHLLGLTLIMGGLIWLAAFILPGKTAVLSDQVNLEEKEAQTREREIFVALKPAVDSLASDSDIDLDQPSETTLTSDDIQADPSSAIIPEVVVAPVAQPEELIIELPSVKTYTDPRDGNVYKVIYVNGAWWMVDNLNYLPLDKAVAEQEGELPHVIGTSASKYGKFYSAEVASQACPSDWKLPSAKDWESLLTSMPFPVVQKLFYGAQSGETALLAKGFKSLLSGWVMNKTHFMVGQTGEFWYDTGKAGADAVSNFEINLPDKVRFYSSQGEAMKMINGFDFSKVRLPCRCVYKGAAPLDTVAIELKDEPGL